ncbi:MAG: radical SAM protein [candidate division WOR-3 bacterium]
MARLSQKFRTAILNPEVAPKIILNKFRSNVSYHILKTRSLAPETINIYPTFRCNLKCEMCFEKYARVEKEMEIQDWLRIIDEIKKFRPRIHISGGEPFVYKDIVKIIEYIKKKNLYLHITTNGTFLEDYAEEIKKFNVNRIDISIDGIGDIHDKIRGVKGTFEKIIKGLDRLNNLKRHLPILKINSIINIANPEKMKDIVHIAQEYKINIIQFIYPLYLDEEAILNHKVFLSNKIKKSLNYWCYASHYRPPSGDFFTIQSVISELPKKKLTIEIFPNFNAEQFGAYYKSSKEFDRVYKGRCRAMWNTATILPDGSIESCPDYVFSNIKEKKFLDSWNNQIIKELRKFIIDKRFFSVCRACCFYYQ